VDVTIRRDPNEIKRPVTSIAWHPEGPDRVLVAHCIVNFQQHTPDTSLECYAYRTGSLRFYIYIYRFAHSSELNLYSIVSSLKPTLHISVNRK